MKIITRQEAVNGGLLKYFTGKPCCNGHLSERYTLNGNCCDCAKEQVAQLRALVKRRRAEVGGAHG